MTEKSLGLRDRKKLRTRDAIRRAALRLIEANGYADTTVEQIAEAAEISPSTFFRYFPSKEAVFLSDDLDELFLRLLAEQPPDVPSLTAFRRAIALTAATISRDDWAFERSRQRLVFSVPELKAAQFDAFRRSVARCADVESRRLGRELDWVESLAFYGALSGALTAVIDGSEGDATRNMLRALEFLESGMSWG
ncbi:transcriptional regulator [Mycolicibacterium phlei]|uniref:TetR family transcriptional regulator n=2 Tax=Mycolicibacterium TaxID=1866885 RepID=A0A5N5VCA3_MYCPH|nr:TetR family transcriptional regulator [Mycolicibacterium phlei]VEG11698.1 transcriptional regulator [Mycobacteroides chelonae]AMO63604.1 HTH-type transcriptional regulator EthR [Mycolicibacterium phlei]EID12857.1 transcriptional regulator [Mycolicibacterium phlei RIVM601174]KAB7759561.1 TetR family transcriptional regulator [Mycolicibacterium phlei DSM 43239 = CCUG 21000]KXW60182.1 TetR family transcriptional regulator [Mycolicibacterium phlei DSM 43072]